jgi:arginine/lysine/ornithine decarboxylase
MFPPGSPLLVPGELISREMIEYINWIREEGITVTGLCDRDEIEAVVK